jgi:protein-L-isoaspartate(D-aspartate) O-methyltransferase
MLSSSTTTGRTYKLRVEQALSATPRRLFVPPGLEAHADLDEALPIGFGQTIPRRSMVYLLTRLLKLEVDHVVLEIGTGSGYHAAVLSRLAGAVFSIERIPELHAEAAERLLTANCVNVQCFLADKVRRVAQYGPFDRIIVTAGAPMLPVDLLDYMRPSGRIVVPIRRRDGLFEVGVVSRSGTSHRIRSTFLGSFVPLVIDGRCDGSAPDGSLIS